MADIYIVYAKEDLEIAEKLHELLSEQWEVWWDDKIVGRFADAIENEIPKSGCIVAIFSASSRKKDTFTEELKIAQGHDIQLLPLRIDDSKPPYPFGSYSYTEMQGWNGELDHRGFMQLKRRLASIVPPRTSPKRPQAIASGKVLLPNVFMSVSSYETQFSPYNALRTLHVFGVPNILFSAYDLANNTRTVRKKIKKALGKYRQEKGGFVLIDSGNYEATRLDDKSWKAENLKKALSDTPHDWTFCFDVMRPFKDPDKAIRQILKRVVLDSEFTAAPVLPIVHAPKKKEGGYIVNHIPQIIRAISEEIQPPLIAIPERELGSGIIARAITVQLIRKELNKLPLYQPIHILGTGYPLSVTILAAAGADSFDGLEWCRMVVDRSTNRLSHFQHFDFFKFQTLFADSSITTAALEDSKVDFAGKVAFHNLDYYSYFVNDMRKYIMEDNVEAFMVRISDSVTTDQLKKEIPGLFR